MRATEVPRKIRNRLRLESGQSPKPSLRFPSKMEQLRIVFCRAGVLVRAPFPCRRRWRLERLDSQRTDLRHIDSRLSSEGGSSVPVMPLPKQLRPPVGTAPWR